MSQVDKVTILKKSSLSVSNSMQVTNFKSFDHSSQPRINDAIYKIESFKEGRSKAAEITNALLFMIAKDNMPLNTVDKAGCHYLLKVLAPLYKIPGRQQFTDLMDKKYEILSLLVKQKLEAAENITLTCDVWTEVLNTVSFLGVSAHYIYDNVLTSTTVGVFELDQRHTGEYLGEVLLSVCNNWNMPTSKIKAVVTNDAANIVSAVHIVFGYEKHLSCFSHTLNLIPAKMLENLSDLKNLIDKVKTIVTYFKHSVVASDKFRKIQQANSSETPLKLIQEVSTRWSSTFYMLKRFLKLIDHITPILIKLKNSPKMLTAIKVATANKCIKILQPFEQITREISAEKNVTSSKIIPMIYLLSDKIRELQPESEIGQNLKKYILREIDSRFNLIENNELLAIATILDPRFKKMYFRSNLACANAISKINKQIKNMILNYMENDRVESSLQSEIDDASSLWNHHNVLMIKTNNNKSENNFGSNLHIELKKYLSQPILSLKTDPIEYWVSLKITGKYLSNIALEYLSVVETLVPSERMFSQTENIMTDSRNRLKGDRLSRLLFLSSLDISDWHLTVSTQSQSS